MRPAEPKIRALRALLHGPITRVLLLALLFLPNSRSALAQERPRLEIPYGEEQLVITADLIETRSERELVAEGNVVATFVDATLKASKLSYDPDTQRLIIEGDIQIIRGPTWLRGSRAVIELSSDTGVIFDASGFTDDELYVNATEFRRTGPDRYVAEDAYLTSCVDAIPKWSFQTKKVTIDVDGLAKASHTLFRIKRVPVFYFPWVAYPTGRRERSSGILIPTYGNSNNRGTRISQRFYLVMGRSADAMIEGDYYSKRGFGGSVNLRARPNHATVIDLTGEGVDDRQGAGGASFYGVAETRFSNGFRGVADFSLVSSFLYRQAFTDNFFRATRPTETSRLFATNNFSSGSFNFQLMREETIVEKQSVITNAAPEVGLRLTGNRIPSTPLYFDLDTSAGGLSRRDPTIESPGVSQRFDLFPSVYGSIPLFQGLRLTPRLGVRETFYSDSVVLEDGERTISGNDLHRRYLDFAVDLKGWGLSRIYGSKSGTRWKHLIEPVLRYRLIDGIDEFDNVIRFDELDAIADTSELDYSLINRFFSKPPGGGTGAHEWLSVRVSQKYFFDPTFGGALKKGSINQFYPLSSLTGLPYAISERDFSPLTTVMRFNPGYRISFDFRSDYDTQAGDFRSLSLTGFYRREKLSFTTTYFVTNELLAGFGKSNQIQGSAGFGEIGRGFSALGSLSYDALASRFLSHRVRASYFWDCCGISAEVRGFNITARNERQIRFSFFLKGIGTFGTIRRPERVF
jgi:LPS-assembly protein